MIFFSVTSKLLIYLQASSEHSVCFAVPENEVKAVSAALHTRFRQALEAGRLSKVFGIISGRDENEMLRIIIFLLILWGLDVLD